MCQRGDKAFSFLNVKGLYPFNSVFEARYYLRQETYTTIKEI